MPHRGGSNYGPQIETPTLMGESPLFSGQNAGTFSEDLTGAEHGQITL